MTTQQLLNRFSFILSPTGDPLPIGTEVALHWLNSAQLKLVQERWTQPTPGAWVEQQLQAQEDLAILKVNELKINTVLAGEGSAPGGFFADQFTMPADVFIVISLRASIRHRGGALPMAAFDPGQNRLAAGADVMLSVASCKRVSPDDIEEVLRDPFSRPTPLSPVYTRRGLVTSVFTDSTFVAPAVFLSYIRVPKRISLDPAQGPEIPEYLHEELVESAVNLMRANSGSSQNPSQDVPAGQQPPQE